MYPWLEFLAWLTVGAMTGGLSSVVLGIGLRHPPSTSMVIGMTGGLGGGFPARWLLGDAGGVIANLAVAIAGACFAIAVWRAVSRRSVWALTPSLAPRFPPPPRASAPRKLPSRWPHI